MGIIFGHRALGSSRSSLIYFGQKEQPKIESARIGPSASQDVFTGTTAKPVVTPPAKPFQFNKTHLLEKISEAKVAVIKAPNKTQKDTPFTDYAKMMVDEAVRQLKAQQAIPSDSLFLEDFVHEVNGFAMRALNFLAWDNIADGLTHDTYEKSPEYIQKIKSKLCKPQKPDGPVNTMTVDQTDALLCKAFHQMFECILRYEPFIQENWIDGSNAVGCQKAFDLASTVISQKAKEKGIQLELPTHEDLAETWPQITMSPYKLYTVLTNLGLNAIKYTPATSAELREGKVTLQLSISPSNTEGEVDLLQIDVTDNGIGIPKPEQEKVVSGKRAQNAVSEGIEGTGYGLQRVKKLSHTLEIESPVNPFHASRPGTRITAQLPVDGIIEKLD
jgi:anti-sigma regulatory factor (Ser/Thr protein kinase)